jgi:membrane protease YdiL (CAAX protease family)
LIAAFIADLPLNSVLSAFRVVPAQPLYQNLYMLVQGLSSFITFIVLPIYFVKHIEKESLNSYLNSKNLYLSALALIVPLALSLMMVNSIFIEWNMNVHLPSGLHEFFKRFEDQAKEATDFLTSFYSLTYFIFAFVVVAIIPAVGEEFLFRGLIQKYMTGIVNNPHVAIWLTAIFFSAFHMQFFGFVPRMILGAFFGYLYYFSGNIWYAIGAHFVNNGFTGRRCSCAPRNL